MPRVSVIVPVYNVGTFLQDCIDSLMNQSFNDYEVIFVNDASTDDSLNILRSNEEKYQNMKVIDSPINLKQGGARNLGIKAALSPWIAFADSDDMVSPDFLLNLVNSISEDADVVFCQYSSIEEDTTYADILELVQVGGGIPLINWDVAVKQLNGVELDDSDREKLMVYPIGGVYCGLWKRDLIVANGVYYPEGMRYEDNYWVTLIKPYIKKIIYIEKVGYYYRKNSMSTVHRRNQEYQFDRIEIENGLLQELNRRGLLNRFWKAEEYIYTTRYVVNSFWLFLRTFDVVPKEKISRMIADLKHNFPMWRRNPYYRSLTPMREKLKNWFIVNSSSILIALWKMKQRLKSLH